jgi:hypothetical protein
MILLPLLIKEKVEYYYYFDKWKDLIKIMHNQYKCRVRLRFNNQCVIWSGGKKHYTILSVLDSIGIYKSRITNFDHEGKGALPSKYYYSSGLNHPQGYK